jgi:hypothetical protein
MDMSPLLPAVVAIFLFLCWRKFALIMFEPGYLSSVTIVSLRLKGRFGTEWEESISRHN